MDAIDPQRGEIWKVRFDKTLGQEIRKERRALVMNVPRVGRDKMRIVVPITTGDERFEHLFWMTRIRRDSTNGLENDSFADASQIQAVSLRRFSSQVGALRLPAQIDSVADAIALCIGQGKNKKKRKRK
ncbi:MAG: type II toxin-antitoxin system PemK/MazF family toxin [Anaerolineae bacterium]|nr:type II toxin-antitoxin system PemK/MazF family toxin [Anaerolineae bacterium]